MTNWTGYEVAYHEMVEAFGKAIALYVEANDSDYQALKPRHVMQQEADAAAEAAFEVAEKCGWDYQNDQEWIDWSELGQLAGGAFVCAHALRFALKNVKVS
jgi:hypothetical protein